MSAQSRVDFHMGEALHRVASSYATIIAVVFEQVQNAIDANAHIISVVINRKTRHIAIRDDGDGVSVSSFEAALRQVCLTQKTSGKLGRFGIGLISPIGKCDYSTFTSFDTTLGQYIEWTFRSNDIRKQERDVTIPMKTRNDLVFLKGKQMATPRGTTTVMWRTEVNILQYTEDKYISRIDDIDYLADAIFEQFGSKMRRANIMLNLKFIDEKGNIEVRENLRPKQFTGRALQNIVLNEKSVGKVFFQLYLAPKTTKGQTGKVLVGEADNDFRFPMTTFVKTAEGLLSPEAGEALCSGIFEGEILGEGVTLHVSRKSFEKDDALVGFCSAIETWYQKHGAKYLEDVKEARREQRYQELGLESLREIEQLLMHNPAFADLRKVIDSFKLGTVGKGHVVPPEERVKGPQEEKSLTTVKPSKPKHPDTPSDSDRPNKLPDTEHEQHKPFTVAGPRGSRRTLVKHGSFGLQFSHIPMDGSSDLWTLDTREGILRLNMHHPVFVMCETSNRKIKQLQETVAIHALMLETLPDDWKEQSRLLFDETLPLVLHLYHNSLAFNLGKRVVPSK